MKQFINIFSNISILILIALGLYVIFGLMRVINMAHGEFVMLGAYFQFLLVAQGLPFWLAVIFSVALVCLIGAVVEVSIIRPLHVVGGLSTLLATWGLSIVLRQTVQLIFGPGQKLLSSPIRYRVPFLGDYPLYIIIMVIVSWVVILAFILMFKKTKFGIMLRASMDNPEMAQAVGIPVKKIYFFSFVMGAGFAALAGTLIAPIVGIVPSMGIDYVVRSFFVVIIGGMSSIFSPIGGALIISGVDDILKITFDATIAKIAVLCFAMVIMVLKPRGVFSK